MQYRKYYDLLLAYVVIILLSRFVAASLPDSSYLIKNLIIQWILIYSISYYYLYNSLGVTQLKDYIDHKPVTFNTVNNWVLITILLWSVMNLIFTNRPVINHSTYIMVIIVLISAPLAEEIFFRQIMLKELKIFGDTKAILISSLAFALMHSSSQGIAVAMIMGLVLGLAYIRTENIFVPMGMHFLFNFLSLVLNS